MKKKLLALFLCCALSFGLVTAALITPAAADSELMIYSENVAVDTVSVPKNEKKTLAAGGLSGYYQWQIQVGGDVWANIAGATGAELEVGYALVANLLYGGTANIRCRVTGAAEEPVYSNTVTVQITDETPVAAPAQAPKAPTVISEAEPVGEPVIIPPQTAVEETPAPDAAPANDLTANAAPASLADSAPTDNGGEEPYAQTFTITINYVDNKDQQVADPWTATVMAGSTYQSVIKSPVVVGYTAEQAEITVGGENIQADQNFTVKYTPALVKFSVKHLLQNVSNDEYTQDGDPQIRTGNTGDEVGETLEKNYPGFYSLKYDATVKIAGDESTVVEVKYDRYYYLINFNLDGGYGVEPIYARYGAPINVGEPTKAGYTFNGWDGEIPTTMPAKSGQSFKAMWLTGNTTYLVQYWLENANDDGYSYDSSAQKAAAAGSTVSGSNDKNYTGFHYDHADQNITVNGDGSTVVNVYYKRNTYTLTFKVDNSEWWESSNWVTKAEFENVKYGEDTSQYWSQAPKGYRWCTSSNLTTAYTYAPAMPRDNLTVYGQSVSSSYKYTIHYYEENTTNKVKEDNVYYRDSKGYYLTDEDYIYIPGFTCLNSGKTNANSKLEYFIYYRRNSYKLDFNNRGEIVKSATVLYENSLTSYNFTPAYPEGLEAGAYKFDGWYTDPGFTTAVDWATAKMPYKNTVLYAKWTPITHTVKTYLTKDVLDNNGQAIQTWTGVPHGTAVTDPPADPERKPYTFVGWFYISDTDEEKAFDFSMPVNRDLDLYAKWRGDVNVDYVIHYRLEDGTTIAEDTTGSALAGTTKTFAAKTFGMLNEGYQTGYYPLEGSHSIQMDIEGSNEYTFVYVAREKVNYTVRYLERNTETILYAEKSGKTSDAVITEKFVQIPGYAPDAYQKQMVLSADDSKNVLTFWYTKDDKHAPLQIIHLIQNLTNDEYTEYQSSTNLNATIGEKYSESPLTLTGFTYNEGKSTASGKLSADGLVLKLYYDRNAYLYEFRFLVQGTEKPIADPVTGSARYQARVTQGAKEVPGYTLVLGTTNPQTIDIVTEEGNTAVNNVKIFYYVEDTVDIKYEVVGPEGCGTLSSYQDNSLNVRTGTPGGSTPTASAGFKFVGWFKDEACTETGKVEASWIGADNKLTPGKTKNYGTEETTAMGYEAATYYAKFEADVANLTITKQGYEEIDGMQSFVFTVTGPEGFSKKIVIQGNGTVVLKGLKIGDYTVTEDTSWSWRYTPRDGAARTITLQAGKTNSVTYVNDRTNNKWLDGNAYCKNVFGTIAETDSGN